MKQPCLLHALILCLFLGFGQTYGQGEPTNPIDLDLTDFDVSKQSALLIMPAWMTQGEFEAQRSMLSFSESKKSGYYRNDKLFQKIQAWEARGSRLPMDDFGYTLTDSLNQYLEEGDDMLMEYVGNFRIANFTRDVGLIWMAGRIKERKGDTALAIVYYELAKMHDHGDSIPRLHLDSLLAPTRSEWATIDQYYKLLEVRARVDTLRPREVMRPMGDQINSRSADYAPYMHKSDSVLIFTSRRDTSGLVEEDIEDPYRRNSEDLYYAEFDIFTNDWKYAERFDEQINSEFNEGSACLSPDGKTLFFTRCDPFAVDEEYGIQVGKGRRLRKGSNVGKGFDPGQSRDADNDTIITVKAKMVQGFGNCDLYSAEYDPSTMQFYKVKNLGANINSEAWDSQPNVSAKGDALYFVSSRNGGYGGTDLYVSRYDSVSESWGPAENLGPLINTAENEVTPYFHRINQTLYFSSTGHLFNYGDYDIFKSRDLGDRWELPANVGPLINTPGNQYYFSISGDGKYIYYANAADVDQDHIRQNFDLYAFQMPMEARPDADVTFRMILRDSVTGYPLVGSVMIVDRESENIEIAPKPLNDSGYVEFNLINNRRYRIYVVGSNFLTIKKDFTMDGDTSFMELRETFEEGKEFVFESMEFKSRSARLSSRLKPNLDYLVEFLQRYPQFKLIIEGHTDADGSPEANQKLSEERAERIKEYLVKKGNIGPEESRLDPTRIAYTGYGETRPLFPNDTEENKSKNRRVEFKLILDELDDDNLMPTDDEFYFPLNPTLETNDGMETEFDWTDEEEAPLEQQPDPLNDPVLNINAELENEIIQSIEEQTESPQDSTQKQPLTNPNRGNKPAKKRNN